MNEADLGDLMALIGASLGTAQGRLTEGTAMPTTRFAMSDATLELKVAVEQSGGKVRVATIGSDAISKGGTDAAALSTVTMRFVAFGVNDAAQAAPAPPSGDSKPAKPGAPAEPGPTPAPGPVRSISKDDAIRALAERPDIRTAVSRDPAITFSASRQRNRKSWLVTARDKTGKMVGQGEIPLTDG